MGTARVQGQRDVALNELAFRGIAINDATANAATVQVYASDSGILFINKFASTTTYTLPAVADCAGKIFYFMAYSAVSIVIAGTTAVMVGGTAGTPGVVGLKVTSTAAIGAWAEIIGDGTNYYCFPGTGTWTYSTT